VPYEPLISLVPSKIEDLRVTVHALDG